MVLVELAEIIISKRSIIGNGSMQLELAQLNIATLVAPLDSPVLADFVADLDRINGLADKSPGFVWRLQ